MIYENPFGAILCDFAPHASGGDVLSDCLIVRLQKFGPRGLPAPCADVSTACFSTSAEPYTSIY